MLCRKFFVLFFFINGHDLHVIALKITETSHFLISYQKAPSNGLKALCCFSKSIKFK